MKKNIKNSIFAGECMIEVSGNTDNLDKKQIKMNLNFGGDTFNAAVYFSRLTNKLFNTFYFTGLGKDCLLYTSPSPRDKRQSRMPSSA